MPTDPLDQPDDTTDDAVDARQLDPLLDDLDPEMLRRPECWRMR